MPLCDDLSLPLDDEEVGRRRFLEVVGGGALGLAALGTAITSVKYLEPPVFYEEDPRITIGKPDEIPVGTVLVLPKQKLYVMRTADGIFALSSVCTHLGCMTRYDKEGEQLACPCHGSRFELDGRVRHGPAPKPLPRLHVALDNGFIVVDTSRRVAADAVLKVA